MPMGLPVTITQLGDRVYEITPTRALAPGGSAVSPANSNESYCFGVDLLRRMEPLESGTRGTISGVIGSRLRESVIRKYTMGVSRQVE